MFRKIAVERFCDERAVLRRIEHADLADRGADAAVELTGEGGKAEIERQFAQRPVEVRQCGTVQGRQNDVLLESKPDRRNFKRFNHAGHRGELLRRKHAARHKERDRDDIGPKPGRSNRDPAPGGEFRIGVQRVVRLEPLHRLPIRPVGRELRRHRIRPGIDLVVIFMVEPDELRLAETLDNETNPGAVSVGAVAVLAEEFDHRTGGGHDFFGGQEVEKRNSGGGFPPEAAAAVDGESPPAGLIGRGDKSEILPERERSILPGGKADFDLARQMESDIPVEHRLREETGVGRKIEGAVSGDAAHRRDGDVAEGIAATAAERQSVGRAAPDHFDRIERRDIVELDVLTGGDVRELRAAFLNQIAEKSQFSQRNFTADQADAVHECAVALLIDAERRAERFECRRFQFAGGELPQGVDQSGLSFDDVFEIHMQTLLHEVPQNADVLLM